MVNSTTTIKRNDYCHRVTSQIQLYLFHCILIRLYMLTFLQIKPFLEGPMSLFSFLSDSRRNGFEFFFRTHLCHHCIRCLHCSLSESRFSFVHHTTLGNKKEKTTNTNAPLRGYCLLVRRAPLFP